MEYLFNSRGQHIANFIDDQLHSLRGQNIGHYRKEEGIFIDMSGRYLGEIINNNRLMFIISSPYKNINYGNYGNYGNRGNYGNPGNHGSIGIISGYKDVATPWL